MNYSGSTNNACLDLFIHIDALVYFFKTIVGRILISIKTLQLCADDTKCCLRTQPGRLYTRRFVSHPFFSLWADFISMTNIEANCWDRNTWNCWSLGWCNHNARLLPPRCCHLSICSLFPARRFLEFYGSGNLMAYTKAEKMLQIRWFCTWTNLYSLHNSALWIWWLYERFAFRKPSNRYIMVFFIPVSFKKIYNFNC